MAQAPLIKGPNWQLEAFHKQSNPGHVPTAALAPSWPVVKSNVQHPDHPEVVGDLVRSLSGQYYIRTEKGECRSVPHAWALDVKDEVMTR